MASFNMRSKPKGLFKWFLHAPSYLYRAHLGFVFGKRFLMIEHAGRRSGRTFRTVLEVAGRYPERDEWIVTSGTGTRADWYLNLQAGGLIAVWVGSHRHAASLRFLDASEAAEVFHRYEAAHPKTAVRLMDTMGVSYDGSDAGRVEMMKRIPMVGFTLDA